MSMKEKSFYTKRTVYDWHRQDTRMTECGDVCVTAAAGWGGGGNNMPYVLEEYMTTEPTAYRGDSITSPVNASQPKPGTCHTLTADGRNYLVQDSLTANNAGGGQRMPDKENFNAVIEPTATVRRLTPLECTRLQGFPDGWLDIGDWTDSKGKKHKGDADAPRYKALGNSIAVGYANGQKGFWCWMAERTVEQLKKDGTDHPTMASLFDGIGGFPLAFSAYGCKPVWASEIEEFPIAVTKKHFPESEV